MKQVTRIKVAPPMRWAGGKRWLVERFPELFKVDNGRLFEPFAGSAAVFFATQPKRATLADTNDELITVYRGIKKDPDRLHAALEVHAAKHSEEYFYKIRNKTEIDIVLSASRTIYLNRTCFNALYRVNKSGKFNVPIGTKDSVIRPDDDFRAAATLLSRAKLVTSDFEKIIDQSAQGDLVFVDPPYTVKHNLNGFVKYNEKIFTFEDQIRLRDSLNRALTRGVDVIVSNADHVSIKDLYENFGSIISVGRKSSISGNIKSRGSTSELLILSPSLANRLSLLTNQ